MPIISVIVPIYKVEPYLKECIDSILNQTFKDFELLLVDDGSPDKCPVICDDYANKDNRIIVIHKENGGLPSARNAGLDYIFEYSDSKYITFVDSDDYVDKEYLFKMYKSVTSTQVACCSFSYLKNGIIKQGNNVDIIKKDVYNEKDFFNLNDNSGFLCVAWSKLYNKMLFGHIRYPEGKICEDEYVTYKVLFYAKNIKIIKDTLYIYRFRDDSITNKINNKTIRLYEIDASIDKSYFYYLNNDIDRFDKNYYFALNKMMTYYSIRDDFIRNVYYRLKTLFHIRVKGKMIVSKDEQIFFRFPFFYILMKKFNIIR